MSATRTQVYLTESQRQRVDRIVAANGGTLAEVIRSALDDYLASHDPDPTAALAATFGADPLISVPDRSEWDRG